MRNAPKRRLTDLQHEGHGAKLEELEQFLMDLAGFDYQEMRDKVAFYCKKDLIESGSIPENEDEHPEDIENLVDRLRLPYTVNNVRYHVKGIFGRNVFAGNKENGRVGSIRVKAYSNSYIALKQEHRDLKYYDYEKNVWRFHNVDSLCEFLNTTLESQKFVDKIRLFDDIFTDDGSESFVLGLILEKGVDAAISEYMTYESTLEQVVAYSKKQGIAVLKLPQRAQDIFFKIFACLLMHEDIVSDCTVDYYDTFNIIHKGFFIDYDFRKDGRLVSAEPYCILNNCNADFARS